MQTYQQISDPVKEASKIRAQVGPPLIALLNPQEEPVDADNPASQRQPDIRSSRALPTFSTHGGKIMAAPQMPASPHQEVHHLKMA